MGLSRRYANHFLCFGIKKLKFDCFSGISSPLITSYYIFEFIIIETDADNHTVETGLRHAFICVGDKVTANIQINLMQMCWLIRSIRQNSQDTTKYYYTVVFNLIFAPLIIVFIWLNSVIAKEIWRKRRPIDSRSVGSSSDETSMTKQMPTKMSHASSPYCDGNTKREYPPFFSHISKSNYNRKILSISTGKSINQSGFNVFQST